MRLLSRNAQSLRIRFTHFSLTSHNALLCYTFPVSKVANIIGIPVITPLWGNITSRTNMTSHTQDPLSWDADWGVVEISQHKGLNDKEEFANTGTLTHETPGINTQTLDLRHLELVFIQHLAIQVAPSWLSFKEMMILTKLALQRKILPSSNLVYPICFHESVGINLLPTSLTDSSANRKNRT